MAHAQQFSFVAKTKAAFPNFFTAARALEIGSLDINGSVRQFFNGGSYTGLDVAPGCGVDVVCPGQDFDAPSDSFDTVISCEAMEHNPHWKETMLNMIRLCRAGGLVIMTCATTGRREHGTTRTSPSDSPLTIGLGWEYYLNLTEHDFRSLPLKDQFSTFGFFTNWISQDLYMIGFKRGQPAPPGAEEHIAALQRSYRRANRLHAMTSGYCLIRILIVAFGEKGHRVFDIRLPSIRRLMARTYRHLKVRSGQIERL